MQTQGRGIILSHIKYGEQSLIVHILNREQGMCTYMVHAPRSKKAHLKKAFIQPLQIVDYIGTHKNKGSIESIREVSSLFPLHGIGTDIAKSSIAMFMGEFLYKVLKEEASNQMLFDFLEHFIVWLNETDERLAEAPILLLHKLSYYLGIQPSTLGDGDYFDMREGRYVHAPAHSDVLSEQRSLLWRKAIEGAEKGSGLLLNNRERRQNLDDWVLYFRLQRSDFGHLNSLDVLKEVFD